MTKCGWDECTARARAPVEGLPLCGWHLNTLLRAAIKWQTMFTKDDEWALLASYIEQIHKHCRAWESEVNDDPA